MTSTRQPSSSPKSRDGQRRHAPKLAVDAAQPSGWLREEEQQSDGRRLPTLTVFLAGAECPFDCVFCDLWRHTLDRPTPRGAIPRQIATGLAAAGPPTAGAIKLYNASNFFDPIAVRFHATPQKLATDLTVMPLITGSQLFSGPSRSSFTNGLFFVIVVMYMPLI